MRILRFIIFAALGLVLLAFALLVPAYLRAIDQAVLERAGAGTPTLLSEATEQARMNKPGVALSLARAAKAVGVPDAEESIQAVTRTALSRPVGSQPDPTRPVMTQVVSEAKRATILQELRATRRVDVHELLKNRNLTRTGIFPPVSSPSGQALDAAILLTGLLIENEQIQPSFRREIEELAASANRGNDSSAIEIVYLNVTSLARRMSWGQLSALVREIGDVSTLRQLAREVTRPKEEAVKRETLAVLFGSVYLAGSADAVAKYLRLFPDEGMRNLRLALRWGKGSVETLVTERQPVYYAEFRSRFLRWPVAQTVFNLLVNLAFHAGLLAVLLKYLLWFDGAFCIARAFSNLRHTPSVLEQPLEVQGIGTLRQQMVAVIFLVLAFAFGEPYLARSGDEVPAPPTWRFPVLASGAVQDQVENIIEPMKNEMTWLAIGVFFLVQLSIYVLCLIKLKEIKRQIVPIELKLRLLDNEENLFDAGLYVGLGGTVLALVLLALSVFELSLMVAYVSTLFGISFVSVLKIFNVRPFRRSLLMESSTQMP